MLIGSAQTIFTPISTSAEYIGSQIYFDSVQPGIEIPVGYTSVGGSGDADSRGETYPLPHKHTYSFSASSANGLGGIMGSNYAEMRRSASNRGFYTRRSLRDSGTSEAISKTGGTAGERNGENVEEGDKDGDEGEEDEEDENETDAFLMSDGFRAPNKSIGTLSLLHSRIGDAGLLLHPFFSRLLASTTEGGASENKNLVIGKYLHTLDLSYCALTSNALGTILSIVTALPNLQRLYLTGNTFSLPTKMCGGASLLTADGDAHHENTVGPNTSMTSKDDATTSTSTTSANSSEGTIGTAVLDAFIDSLCDRWEAHPSLSLVVLDPWLVSNHARFRGVRQSRVSLQRWQALESTLQRTGFRCSISTSLVHVTAGEDTTYSGLHGGATAALAAGRSRAKKGGGGSGAAADQETLSAPARSRRSKKKDLLDDDEDDDEDKPFSNIDKSIDATTALSPPFGGGASGSSSSLSKQHQQANNLATLNNASAALRSSMLRQALVQLRVRESARREALQSEEIAAARTLMSKISASYLAVIRGGDKSIAANTPFHSHSRVSTSDFGLDRAGLETRVNSPPDDRNTTSSGGTATEEATNASTVLSNVAAEEGHHFTATAVAKDDNEQESKSIGRPFFSDFHRLNEKQQLKFIGLEEKMREELARHEESSRARCKRTAMSDRLQLLKSSIM